MTTEHPKLAAARDAVDSTLAELVRIAQLVGRAEIDCCYLEECGSDCEEMRTHPTVYAWFTDINEICPSCQARGELSAMETPA